MNTSFRLTGISLALSLLSVSSALAVGIEKSEPKSVFLNGSNLEWSTAHAYGKASKEEHRAYHKNAEAERVLWMKNNAASIGSQAYRDAYRLFVQNRNLAHRQWHLTKSGINAVDSAMRAIPVRVFETEFTITIIDAPSTIATAGHVYIGTPPSRRSVVLEAERQQKLHSLTVGQQ